jgi:hypothetical protein
MYRDLLKTHKKVKTCYGDMELHQPSAQHKITESKHVPKCVQLKQIWTFEKCVSITKLKSKLFMHL